MIYGIVLTLLGLTCLWAARSFVKLRRRVAAWPVTMGRVTERKSIQPTDRGRLATPGFRWSPEVKFAYRVSGAEYVGDKIWLPWSWTNTREKADAFLSTIPDEVEVRYDAADPGTSCLYPPPFTTVLWYAIPGVLLLGVGVLWILVKIVLLT